jgi:para-nitrobenzyl esterase
MSCVIRKGVWALIGTALVLGTAWAGPTGNGRAINSHSPVVRTAEGPVRGIRVGEVHEFLGIPYAAAPTAEHRWSAPIKPPIHHAVRSADHFRDACPQVRRFDLTEASDVEDCLYLNIAVPTRAAAGGRPRPVLFWIHGGAYVGGGANLYRIDHLADRGDIVVVSVNYRLGALGFLSLPEMDTEAAGAFGIADQEAALRWVHANIARFGGDPERVTIAGESAGAASVCALMAAPERREGLYAQAIVQSLACGVPWKTTATAAASVGASFIAQMGCEGDAPLACLRRAPLSKVLEVQTAMAAAGNSVWSPSVGSRALPRDASGAVSDGRIKVPVLYGGTTDEMRLYVGYEVVAMGHPYSEAEYPKRLAATYGEHAASVEQQYPATQYSSPSTALGTALSDYSPGMPLSNCGYLQFAQDLAKHTTVYQFEFADRQAPPVMDDPGIELGAVHSAELPYFFPGFSNHSQWEGSALSEGSQSLSDVMIDFWASFVRTGRPSAAKAPVWPSFTNGRDVYRLEPGHLGPFDASAAHRCAFWQSIYPSLH